VKATTDVLQLLSFDRFGYAVVWIKFFYNNFFLRSQSYELFDMLLKYYNYGIFYYVASNM